MAADSVTPSHFSFPRLRRLVISPCWILWAIPIFFAVFAILGPFQTDTTFRYSGLAVNFRPGALPGNPTIDPNDGVTAFALGKRAALGIFTGRMPLWNYYEGLGAPLLGEMQSAALFPPTLLLALPNGQVLERALLQLIAGFGAYLFFRRFGLSAAAAIAGGALFELNGVFAWLHNAIFNPVAFLPWLFLSIELLREGAIAERAFRDRLAAVCLGAVAGALALYAGFPEEVYLYSLLLTAWTVFRLVGLDGRKVRTFVVDLAATGGACLALSAPVLVAFTAFLPEANTGGHHDSLYYGLTPPVGLLIQYFLPYIYGPLFAPINSPSDAHLTDIWDYTGGYIGFAPLLLAFGALFTPGRRPTKILLAAWIVIALGASHGWPGIYQAFMLLPFTKIAACFRYLNASWIFCFVFLAAIFVDDAVNQPRPVFRRAIFGASLCAVGVIGAAWFEGRSWLAEFWAGGSHNAVLVLVALSVAAILAAALFCASLIKTNGRRAAALSMVLTAEALLWFFIPYLSHPRGGRLDYDAVAFLKSNVGYQRVVGTSGHMIGANYGSAFGVATLNYDDLPLPQRSIDYIQRRLDTYATTIFVPWFPPLSAPERAARDQRFRDNFPAYAHAGVKYVLASANFNSMPLFRLKSDGEYPYGMVTGDSIDVTAAWVQEDAQISAVSFTVGTYTGQSNGRLAAHFCAAEVCSDGIASLDHAGDGQAFLIALERPVPIGAGAAYSVRIEKLDGDRPVAVWMLPIDASDLNALHATSVGSATPIQGGFLPELGLVPKPSLLPVHVSPTMAVYEIPGYRPYFSAPGCQVKSQSRHVAEADCAAPATLTRLELSMRGWSATVNGKAIELGMEDDAFQTVSLPAGKSRIYFRYLPAGFRIATIAAMIAALIMLGAMARTVIDR